MSCVGFYDECHDVGGPWYAFSWNMLQMVSCSLCNRCYGIATFYDCWVWSWFAALFLLGAQLMGSWLAPYRDHYFCWYFG